MSTEREFATDPLVERLTAFRERGLRLQADLSARLEGLNARLGDAAEVATVRASVALDTRGFPTALDLSVEGRVTPDQLRGALTAAFVDARTANPSLPVEAAGPLAESIRAAASAPEGPTAALRARGVAVSNDLGQATVTALFGDVIAIDATDAWLAASRPEALAEEILALAQRAARESDRFDRFVEEEEIHG